MEAKIDESFQIEYKMGNKTENETNIEWNEN